MMPPLSDLVRDSRLSDTKFVDAHTIHRVVESDSRRRRGYRNEYWKVEKILGRGGFGHVRLEKNTMGGHVGQLRAVKVIHRQTASSKPVDYIRELEAIAKFSHPRYETWFVKSFGWYEDSDSVYIAMEYFPLGDLHHYLHRVPSLPVQEARNLTHQILEGLNEMHTNGFAHRDVKPANILIKSHPPEDWWIKLADFGISKRAVQGTTGPSTLKGTPEFMAPELLGFGTPVQNRGLYDYQAADMWSLGEVAFRLSMGRPTFGSLYAAIEYCRNPDRFPSELLNSSVGEEGAHFIRQLLEVEPSARMSADTAMEHIWMRQMRTDMEDHSLESQIERLKLSEESSPTLEASADWTAIPNAQATTRAGGPSDAQHSDSQAILDRNHPRTHAQGIPRHDSPEPRQSSTGLWARIRQLPETFMPTNRVITHKPPASPEATEPAEIVEDLETLTGLPTTPHIFIGHIRRVKVVAFSPDGAIMVSLSASGSKLWNTRTGKELYNFGFTGCSACFSPDSKQVAIGTDYAIKVMDIPSRNEWFLRGREATVLSVVFLGQGEHLLSATNTDAIFWDVAKAEVLGEYQWDEPISVIAFNPNFPQVGVSPSNNMLTIVLALIDSYPTPVRISQSERIASHSRHITALALSPNGNYLASASYDQTVKIRNSTTGQLLHILKGHTDRVNGVAFSPDSSLLASASEDKSVRIWDISSGIPILRRVAEQPDCVQTVAFSPDGQRIAAGLEDWTIRLWDVNLEYRWV